MNVLTKSPMQSSIKPGTVVLGIGQEDAENNTFKLLFTCRKDGFDFLGQVRLDAKENRVDVEMFNEGYFSQFEEEKLEVLPCLAVKVLSQLKKHSIVPESFKALGKEHADVLIQKEREAAEAVVEEAPVDPRDITAIFDRLNQEYFRNQVDARIEWGRETKTANRRSFRFGSYDSKKNLIRIHPRLQQEFVPVCVLELTIYHEMCHQQFPPVKRNDQWQVHHRDFKKKEREYRHFREATQWEKTNWAKLLTPSTPS